MSELKVVLDTNILLSGIAYPDSVPGKILAAWRVGSIEVVLSDYILEELRRVLPRLDHRHGLSTLEMDDLVDILSIQAEIVEPDAASEEAIRDEQDRPVLGTLLAALTVSGAQHLITGDKDLLALAGTHPIITAADFWAARGLDL